MSLSKEEQQRYSRHLILQDFGAEAQLKLKNSRVLVVGAGGLGCPCLLYLASAGVGFIGIADDDIVSLSNLQRQILFSARDVGRPKVQVAKSVLLEKNPLINIQTHERITADNVFQILGQYDLVIDGSDNFSTRYLLNDACVISAKPYIYGALFKFEGQVSTFNYKEGPTYRCLYPEPPAAAEVPACGETGVLGVLPGIIGTYQATEAIKVITGIGEPLSGKLLMFNLLSNDIDILKFKPMQENRQISELSNYDELCGVDVGAIDVVQLNLWQELDLVQLIDVREENEYEAYNMGGLNIPLDEMEENMNLLDRSKKIVLVCQTGLRSQKAIEFIKSKNPDLTLFNLKGGIEASF